MNKKGSVIVQILILLVVVVVTSAVVLVLVRTGVLETSDRGESVLDTEFIPLERSGTLVLKEFEFCGYVDENYQCSNQQERFSLGDEVHFKFVVESSTLSGQIIIVENYRLKDPRGDIILDITERDDFYFNTFSNQETELVNFKDYFIIGDDEKEGMYTLELQLENPLLNKKLTLSKNFEVTGEIS